MGWVSAVQPHSMGGVRGGEEAHTHTHTHTGTRTGTYTRMLHLPFSDLPLKKCPKKTLRIFFSGYFLPRGLIFYFPPKIPFKQAYIFGKVQRAYPERA